MLFVQKNIFTLLLFLIPFISFGQAKTAWKEGYKLSVLDFQAEAPKSRIEQGQTYYLAVNLDFNFALNSKEYTSSKNSNRLVRAAFSPDSSWLQQGEGTETLLKYAQTDFDLAELYARKYRKRLYQEVNTLPNKNILQKIRDELKTEMAKRRLEMQNAMSESDTQGAAFQEQILQEIRELAEFCYECQLAKKKK